MANLFDFTTAQREHWISAVNAMIANFGSTCRLVHTPHAASCSNCILDPIGQKSANKWRSGGPAPFPLGSICPVCNGAGFRFTEQTEDVTFLCEWEPKKFQVYQGNIVEPYSIVECQGYYADLPKVQRANEFILNVPMHGVSVLRYRRYKEPLDIYRVAQRQFFIVVLERVG
jgi:hypothetical protein